MTSPACSLCGEPALLVSMGGACYCADHLEEAAAPVCHSCGKAPAELIEREGRVLCWPYWESVILRRYEHTHRRLTQLCDKLHRLAGECVV